MQFIIIIFSIVYIIYSILMKKDIYDPSVMFVGIWGSISFMNLIRLYDIDVASSSTYAVIFIGIISYLSGYFLAKCKVKKNNSSKKNDSKKINIRIVSVLSIFCFIILIIPFFKAVKFLSISSLYDIRYKYQNNILGNGAIEILYTYFASPFLVVMIVISLNNLFCKNIKIKYLLFTLIQVFMNIIISGGRFLLLYIIISMILLILLNRNYLKEKFKIRHVPYKYKIFVIIAIILIITVSALRGSDVFKTFYAYSSGSVVFLEYLLGNTYNKPLYGLYSFNGFIRPFFVILRFLGIMQLPYGVIQVEDISLMADKPYWLTKDIIYNSFTTCFYAPYIDGGKIGVVIIMILFGFISNKIYRNINFSNEFSIELYILTALMIVLSFFRLLTVNYFALAYIYLAVCYINITVNRGGSFDK